MAAPDQTLTSAPGLYALALRLPRPMDITIGALGAHAFPAGQYLYVGSAWGPGGLAARVGRHLRGDGAVHWHVDYLRAQAEPVALWWAAHARDECAWAGHLLAHPGAEIVVPRFGASDCACAAHLARVGETLSLSDFFPGAAHVDLSATRRGLS